MKIFARRTLSFLALASVLIGAPITAQSPSSRIPESVPSMVDPHGPPQWVSARAMARSNGELRWDLLRPAQRDLFQSQFQSGRAEERGCAGPGFLSSLPGLMLELEVDEVFKENPAFRREEGLFIFYPRGEFTIGRHRFCVEGTHLPAPPAKGTRVMVFPFSVPTDLDGSVVDLHYSEIFLERPGGRLDIPALWRQVPEVGGLESLEELATMTRVALDSESQRNDQ